MAARISERGSIVKDAALVGTFILETGKGRSTGSLRVRYVSPDLYRVDAFMSGAAGAGGGTSILVEGDTTFTYSDSEGGLEAEALERGSVVPVLADLDLQLEDLKSLAMLAPYLWSMDLNGARCSRVRDGYLLEGEAPYGDNISIWIDEDKEVVTRGLRLAHDGLPLVETKLGRFRRLNGEWRATRVSLRHFGQKASFSVQYDRISFNEGLQRVDLLIRGMAP